MRDITLLATIFAALLMLAAPARADMADDSVQSS